MNKINIKKTFLAMILLLSCTITLCMPATVKAQDTSKSKEVKMSKSMTIKQGNKKALSIHNNSDEVKWKSSNKSVVSITVKNDSTIICKAKKKGSAKITATVNNKKYVCNVKVTKDNNPYTRTHKGKATYYDMGSSIGTCDLKSFAKNYYTCAMNKQDYLKYGLAGAYIQVTDKDGDKVNVLVVDMLPSGKSGDIDLSRKAFKKIEPLGTGRMNISWKVIKLPTSKPVSFRFKKGSNKYWAALQVRNHAYPIKSVEYKKNGKFVKLKKTFYNYYIGSGMGKGPFTLRITDIHGHTIIEKNIGMNKNGKVISGKNNFD